MGEHPTSAGSAAVDGHLASLAAPHRETLGVLRATLTKLLPHAEEGIKWGMPTVMLHGKNVAHYQAFTNHCSYFPASGSVLEEGAETGAYETSKGALRFGVGERLPVGLVRKLVNSSIAEISAVENGIRRDYFPDGALKAEGKAKHGRLHGEWRWWRADGSLMRTGRFRDGEQTGTWTTYDRSGQPTKVTDLG